MSPDDDPRLTDEATGLPPLEQVEADHALLVVAWTASAGVATSPLTGAAVPVRFLSVRGLSNGPGGRPEWAQVHLAVPVEHAVDVAAALAKGSTEDLGEPG